MDEYTCPHDQKDTITTRATRTVVCRLCGSVLETMPTADPITLYAQPGVAPAGGDPHGGDQTTRPDSGEVATQGSPSGA